MILIINIYLSSISIYYRLLNTIYYCFNNVRSDHACWAEQFEELFSFHAHAQLIDKGCRLSACRGYISFEVMQSLSERQARICRLLEPGEVEDSEGSQVAGCDVSVREEVVVETVRALLDRRRAVVEEIGVVDGERGSGRGRSVEHDEGAVGPEVGGF